jgi:glycosyltransferase involved in cell wall biosynthesis
VSRPIRLTVVMTHPVQYYAPWFRYVAARASDLDLTVLYATAPTPSQQGVGFDRAFTWDIPLTEGYRCRIVRLPRPGESVHSDTFRGLDVPEIGEALAESDPDVTLIGGWYSITLLRALWACRRRGIPVLYRGDTHLGSAPAGWRRPAWTLKTWTLLRCFDGYLSVGHRARAYLRRFGAAASQIFAAPHCVDNEYFAWSAASYQTAEARAAARASLGLPVDDFVVLFVGKLESKKRPQDAITAVARLGGGASLLVVGAGPLESVCREQARTSGVHVSWAGFVNQSQLGRAYAAADCLVLPSDWGETWGLVVNEAMATGLPCVVSDRVGCAPDLIIPGQTGDVFAFGDADALAAALARVRKRRQEGWDFATACRARVASYSHETATTGLVAACQDAAQRRPRASARESWRTIPRIIVCCGHMSLVSGLEFMTFEVLRTLRARGAAVHSILNTWANWDRPQEPHVIAGLAERIGASWSTGYYWYGFERRSRNPLKLGQLMWDILRTSGGLLRDAWHFRPSHVDLPDYLAVLRNAPALMLLRMVGCRVVFRLGNAPEPGPFYRRVWRYGVNPFVDRFVCNSRFTETELLAHGIPSHKVSRIYNCAPSRPEPDLSDIRRDAHRIIYVGQIIPEKGVDLVLDALAILVGRGHDVALDVVGEIEGWAPPPYARHREALVARAGLPDLTGRVRFLGWRTDVPDLLARASLLCCPSRPEQREGFGLVVLEAKLAGVPGIVCPTGALPELIEHGEDGWVASEVSAAALAEGLEYFLKDPVRLQRARHAARRSAERFSRERFAEAWWAVFQEKTERRPSSPER